MNILIDKLPVEYKGLKINTNFRSFILFEILMQDNSLSKEEKIMLTLNLFFENPPNNINDAIECILWFYKRGKTIKNKKNTGNENKKIIYSFEEDADLIYSAFLSQYNIDLNEIDYMHWFKFKSLFEGLNEENKICEIMSYRAIDINKIKNEDEKKKYRQLQNEYALPDNRTVEEKEQDFANSFW